MLCCFCKKLLPDEALFCCFCGKPQNPPRKQIHTRPNGAGSVTKRKTGRWEVTVTLGYYIDDATGKKRRKTLTRSYARRTDALAAAVTLKTQPPDARETLDDLYRLYIASRDYLALSDSQQQKLSYAWKRLQPLQLRPIASLTVDDLQRAVDSAGTAYYPARDMKVMLSHLYNLAVRRELVPYNKSENIDLPPSPKPKRESWTDAQIDAVWSDWRQGRAIAGYVLIMCYCGLRFGEISTITLDNVHVSERYMIGGIKSEAGIDRTIPIAQRVLPVVEHFANTNKMFLMELPEDTFYTYYWQMVDRLGLPHYPPQTCRHYYFTSLTAAGIQPGIITETGGHASYMTTVKNYVRIQLADKLAAVDKINPGLNNSNRSPEIQSPAPAPSPASAPSPAPETQSPLPAPAAVSRDAPAQLAPHPDPEKT